MGINVVNFAEELDLLQELSVMMSPDRIEEDGACKNATIVVQNMQKNITKNIMNMKGE